MNVKKHISLLLAVELELFRKGLASLIAADDDLVVVGEVGDGKEAIEQVPVVSPDVVVAEVVLPVLDGISACRRIRSLHPATEVLFLTSMQPFMSLSEYPGNLSYSAKTRLPPEEPGEFLP